MKLPHGLTTQQIRILQEFRRKTQDDLTAEDLSAINHPGGGGGDESARGLVEAGFLTASGEAYSLTEKGKEFLSRPSVPLGSGADE